MEPPVEQLGVGHSEEMPVETALPVDTPVSAKRVCRGNLDRLSDAVWHCRGSRKPRPQRGRQVEQGGV